MTLAGCILMCVLVRSYTTFQDILHRHPNMAVFLRVLNIVHLEFKTICNISKTNASVSSGVPNTEKQMKARGRRPSAFIVSRCLEPLMKHEARVFEMASQTSVKISWNFFRRIGHQKV